MNRQEVQKKLRVVNFVLDETGSMASCKDVTISGFNEHLRSLQDAMDWKTLMTLTKFNSEKMEQVYHLEDVLNVQPLTPANYKPESNTPLYDAIAHTIRQTERDMLLAADRPPVLCVIQTDGEENSSREYNRDSVQRLIEQKKRDGWKIVCLGADVDAWQIGGAIGLNKGDTFSYDKNRTLETFNELSLRTKEYFDKGADADKDFFTEDPDRKDPQSPRVKKTVACKDCGNKIRLPLDRGVVEFKCPNCSKRFTFDPAKGVL